MATVPTGLVTIQQFYAHDPRRHGSRVLSYGSSWDLPGWTGRDHAIELLWFGATHELVAYYLTYDWDRLSPGKVTRDAVVAEGLDLGADSGLGIGRTLGDLDIATSEIDVEILGVLSSDLRCHETLWGWQWWQHHPVGLDHIRAQVRNHAES